MVRYESTVEDVRLRHEFLRRLAGPQPMIPFIMPSFGSVRRLIHHLAARLGGRRGAPVAPSADTLHATPIRALAPIPLEGSIE